MEALMLGAEFKFIKAQYKTHNESLVLLLQRCLKIADASKEVQAALWMIIERKQIIKSIVDNLKLKVEAE